MRDDPKAVWQSQPEENERMTMQLIQAKAREARAATRKKLIGTIAGPLAASFAYVFAIREFPSFGNWLHPLFGSAVAWSVAGLYFLNRGMWGSEMPGDAGIRTGIEFCLGELQRRRNLSRRLLVWSLAPILLALATLVLALAMAGTTQRSLVPNGLPFLFLAAVWIVSYFVIRARELRALQREIDELNGLGG
jgi:hypothetical protein